MSTNSVVSPFNRLLNSISDKLSPQNLQSLIHICETYIPESRREEIRNGLDVFRILKHQNVIGDDFEKACNLEKILKDIRPKRKDIIKRVRDFITTNYEPYYDFPSSGESCTYEPPEDQIDGPHPPPPLDKYNSSSGPLYPVSGPQRGPFIKVQTRTNTAENHCSMDCCCFGFKCYARRIPSCVLLTLTGIMAILTFLATVLWFERIPKSLYSKMGPDATKAGGYVVGCCGVVTIGFLCWWIYRKVNGNWHVGEIPYESFKNDIPIKAAVGKAPPANMELISVKKPKRSFSRGNSRAGSSSLVAAVSAQSGLERGQSKRHILPRQQRRPNRKSTTEGGSLENEIQSGETWGTVQTD